LDGVRGIAILLVLVWHYAVVTLWVQPDSAMSYVLAGLRLSWSGVDLFFVLSGFLIGGILIDNRGAKNYFRVFYMRRTCRIFPLYFIWLMIFCDLLLAEGILFSEERFRWLLANPLPLFSYLTFTQNIAMALHNVFGSNWMGVTWSLAVEEQFYLTLPFIIRYCHPRKLPWLLLSLVLVAPLLRVVLFFWDPYQRLSVYVLMPCRADALLLGVLAAWMVRQQAIAQLLGNHRKVLRAALGISLAGVIGLIISGNTFIISPAMVSFGYSWLALFYTCFLLQAVTQKRGIIKAIASNLLLRRLGIIAYGVYVFHQGVLGLTHGLILDQAPRILGIQELLVTLLALAITLAAASVSWRFFEKPLVALGHDFQYEKKMAPSMLPSSLNPQLSEARAG